MTENQPMSTSSGAGRRLSPDLAIVLLVLIWGSNFSVVKAALSEFSPLAFNATRFVLASSVLAVFLWISGVRPRFPKRDVLRLVGLGLLGNVVYQALFIHGIHWTRAGNAALMLSAVPLIVALLSVGLKHETISRAGWAGVALSIGGIALILWGSSRGISFGSDTLRGDLTMLAAALGWSVYTVLSAPYVQKYGTLPVTAFTMWVGTVGLVAVSTPALLAQEWGSISLGAWGGLVFYSNTVPIVALIVAWLTLGEVPTGVQVAGTVMILGGIGLARLRRKPREVPEDLCPPE